MAHEFKAANMVRVTMLQLDISDASNKLIRVADCTIYLRMRAPRNMIEYIIYALLRIVDIREKKKNEKLSYECSVQYADCMCGRFIKNAIESFLFYK